MLVRDINGKIVIVSRKDCKNEILFNKKLYDIRFNYTKKYKSITTNPPKDKYKDKDSKINIDYLHKNTPDD